MATIAAYKNHTSPTIDASPVFTISLFYLMLTLLIETPIVYFCLRKKAKSTRKLIKSILIANGITTAIAFIIEHILCRGSW